MSSILTNIGKQKIADAIATGTQIEVVDFAVGDGNGLEYEPTESQTALVNEVYRASLSNRTLDPQNPYWVTFEIVIPYNVGGWWIREIGLFDTDGDLIAVMPYSSIYKPVLNTEQTARELQIKIILEVSNADTVVLTIDSSSVLASVGYVNTEIEKLEVDVSNFKTEVNTLIQTEIEAMQQDIVEFKQEIQDDVLAFKNEVNTTITTEISEIQDDVLDFKNELNAIISVGGSLASPLVETILASSVSGTGATVGGRITDFKDCETTTTQVRIAYKKQSIETYTYTAWVNHSTLANYTTTLSGLETSTTYDFKFQIKDVMRPSMGIIEADVKTFLTLNISSDVDSIINIQGSTTGVGVLAFDSTSVPTLTNATLVSNEAVANADSASATTKEFSQQVGQTDFSQIKLKASFYPKKFVITAGQTFPKSGIDIETTIDNFVASGSKLLLGSGTTITKVDVVNAIKTAFGGVETWTQRTSSFGTTDIIYDATYGNGLFVAVGLYGKLATSPDGITWTQGTSSFGTTTIYGVTYGNGLFVAVGYDGRLATSPDGITWTQRTSSFASTTAIRGVTYGNGLFVAVGHDGRLATSPDGITWTQRTSGFGTTDIRGVTYGNGLFVAVGESGKLATSPGGITWTQRTSSFEPTDIIYEATYGNGLFVAVGSDGRLATSPDGITWTQRTSSFLSTSIYDVTYGNGLFVAVGNDGRLATSPDGITWTQRTSSFGTTAIWGVTYGNGLFVAVGYDGRLATSEPSSYKYSCTTTQSITALPQAVYKGGQEILSSVSGTTNVHSFTTDTISTTTRSGDMIELTANTRTVTGRYVKLRGSMGNGDKLSRLYAELFI